MTYSVSLLPYTFPDIEFHSSSLSTEQVENLSFPGVSIYGVE